MCKPDLNAPRYRKERVGTANIKFFKLMREKIASSRSLSNNEIKNLIGTFNGLLWENVIDKRDGVELPEQLGHVFIGTCPKKVKKNVDFKKTADYMQVIQHRNWESDNFLAKIFFTTYGTKYTYKNHDVWGFEPTRDFKRKVGQEYPKKWKQYVVAEKNKKISVLFKKFKYKDQMAEETKQNLETYNEFEI